MCFSSLPSFLLSLSHYQLQPMMISGMVLQAKKLITKLYLFLDSAKTKFPNALPLSCRRSSSKSTRTTYYSSTACSTSCSWHSSTRRCFWCGSLQRWSRRWGTAMRITDGISDLYSEVWSLKFKSLFMFEDRYSKIKIIGMVWDLRTHYDFFEQRIGVSETPISGGGKVQSVDA